MHYRIVALFLLAPALSAQEPAQAMLATVRTLKCDFPRGFSTNVATEPPDTQEGPGSEGVVFDAIDRAKGHARLIGNVGAADLIVLVGENTLTLVELTPMGTPMVTVVYGQFVPGTTELIAVQSRHFGLLRIEDPVILVGQYYGSCRSFE